MASPIRGRRPRLIKHDLLDYLAGECFEISERVRDEVIVRFKSAFPVWNVVVKAEVEELPSATVLRLIYRTGASLSGA